MSRRWPPFRCGGIANRWSSTPRWPRTDAVTRRARARENRPRLEPLEPRIVLATCQPGPPVAAGDHSVQVVSDENTGNCEYRLFSGEGGDAFHFGTFVVTPVDAVNLRPRPDRFDPDAFGVSWFLAPFIAGEGSDSVGLDEIDVVPTPEGIEVTANGAISSAGGTAGTWQYEMTIRYDFDAQIITGTADQTLVLDGPIDTFGGDLNLFRLNSNFLHDVLRDDGTTGDTGDSTGVRWAFHANNGTFEQEFVPTPEQPATFPQDTGDVLTIDLLGNVNETAGDGPESKRTPDLLIESTSLDPTVEIAFGASWNPDANSFEQDNFGITPLVFQATTEATTIRLRHEFSSTPPETATLRVEDQAVDEGDTGTKRISVPVRLDIPDQPAAGPPGAFSVDFEILENPNGGAEENDDFIAAPQTGTLEFSGFDGELQFIELEVIGDSIDEADEALTVVIRDVSTKRTLTDERATVTILDDDEDDDTPPPATETIRGDYDGDGRTDLALYRFEPSTGDPEIGDGVFHLRLSNEGGAPTEETIRLTDVSAHVIPIAGDFDGDGIADAAVIDPNFDIGGDGTPDVSRWIILRSGDQRRIAVDFGAAGIIDRPAPADFDGDGITDLAMFRANSDITPGAAEWFIRPSSDTTAGFRVPFGAPLGRDLPAVADYDGDGLADIATFRPLPTPQDRANDVPFAGQWFILPSGPNQPRFDTTLGAFRILFGAGDDVDQPAPADHDGDGLADIATFRSVSDLTAGSAQWFVRPSDRPAEGFTVPFGPDGSIAAVGAYRGAERPDLAVFDPDLGRWQIRTGTEPPVAAIDFGPTGDDVVPVLAPLFFRLRATGNLPHGRASIASAISPRADIGDDEPEHEDRRTAQIDEALAILGGF